MVDPRKPTRLELSQVFKDPRTLKAFEKVFDLIPGGLDSFASALSAIRAQAAAGEASARTPSIDYVDFVDAPHVAAPGRVAWNSTDDTLNLHHSDGVTQQVGLESYIRVKNVTGSTIPNGSVVGFSGSSSGIATGAPYIANGSQPSEHALGIATQDIPSGQIGRVTTLGLVHGLNTSPLTIGAALYASASVAGGYTTTKPTPPNQAVLLGFVSKIDAVDGEILVRPSVEQTKRFANVTKTTDQTPAAINTAYGVTFDAISPVLGFSLGSPASRIVAASPGLYSIDASVQLQSGSASVKNVWVWFRKNGVDIASSAVKFSLESATATTLASNSMFTTLAASDYIELMFAADSVNVTLKAFASTAFAPSTPSASLTITQVQ